MKRAIVKTSLIAVSAVLAGFLALRPGSVRAHCDTLGGPVVKDGRIALEKGDVTPVLKWIKNGHEAELRSAFAKALAVRGRGPEARDLADRYFLETLVRLHRAGENAPYTGLKDEPVEAIVAMADEALERGSGQALIKALGDHLAKAVREKYERALTARESKDTSVEAGREFVEAYVAYTHYLEALHSAIVGAAADHH